MPFLHSNIPSKMFYSSFGAEILRSARTTTDRTDFKNICKTLTTRMARQGGKRYKFEATINKMFGRHFETFRKYSNTSLEFIETFFS